MANSKERSGAPAGRNQGLYKAQSAGIFDFLKQTFFQMPRSVQVIGWLVFLMVFVLLVLRPLLGVTYIEGTVTGYYPHSNGKTRLSKGYKNLRVYRESETLTNSDGAFTLRISGPVPPFVGLNVKFGSGSESETVRISSPVPFVSMFRPNLQSIYYLADSVTPGIGGTTKRFFADLEEFSQAAKLADSARTESADQVANQHPLPRLDLHLIAAAHANVLRQERPAYILNISSIRLDNTALPAEVYLKIRVGDPPVSLAQLPSPISDRADFLTLLPGIDLTFSELHIPLVDLSLPIEITAYNYKSGLFRDTPIGSILLRLSDDAVETPLRRRVGSLDMVFELLPPIDIGRVSVPFPNTPNVVEALWLVVAKQHQNLIRSVSYNLGPGYEYQVVPPSVLDDADLYSYLYSHLLNAPNIVVADVRFTSGTQLLIEKTQTDTDDDVATKAHGSLFRAKAYIAAQQPQKALDELAKVERLPPFGRAFRAAALGNLGRYKEALADYEWLIGSDSYNAAYLNGYAWLIADKVSNPSRQDLKTALKHARAANGLRGGVHYVTIDTIGWIHFKLEEYEESDSVLNDARTLVERENPSNSAKEEICFHLGESYLKLGREADAVASFQCVIQWNNDYGVGIYVELAEKRLSELEQATVSGTNAGG